MSRSAGAGTARRGPTTRQSGGHAARCHFVRRGGGGDGHCVRYHARLSVANSQFVLSPSLRRARVAAILAEAMCPLGFTHARGTRGRTTVRHRAFRNAAALQTRSCVEDRLSDAIPEELWNSKSAALQNELRQVRTKMERHEVASQAYETAGLQILELAQNRLFLVCCEIRTSRRD
jgi:hypothetical protein